MKFKDALRVAGVLYATRGNFLACRDGYLILVARLADELSRNIKDFDRQRFFEASGAHL